MQKEGSLGYLGFKARLRLPRAYRSLLRPSSVSQTKPSSKRCLFSSRTGHLCTALMNIKCELNKFSCTIRTFVQISLWNCSVPVVKNRELQYSLDRICIFQQLYSVIINQSFSLRMLKKPKSISHFWAGRSTVDRLLCKQKALGSNPSQSIYDFSSALNIIDWLEDEQLIIFILLKII